MILVTGANGFVGRSLMRILSQGEREVKAYAGRINDPLRLRSELEGVETVIHLCGAEAHDRVRQLDHVDVEGTERLLEESQRAKLSRLIVLSRLNADSNSLYPLLRAKGEAERFVRQSSTPFTILRSATLFGREDRFLNVIGGLAAWSWPFVWLPGGGLVAMQPLWVEDVARCLVACLERPDLIGKTIEVAGEERLRYAEIVRQVLHTAQLRRLPISVSIKLIRPLSALIFGWRVWPPVTRFMMDRFSVPEVAQLDSVLRHFDFHPARMGQRISYLRQRTLRRKLFQAQ
ncbi:MAG: NAD(P)H-binding protein [Rubricoccaceae bacterium]|nr:NAD(P)H-binding protein [Rubricoccaceae bacterium]